MPIHVREALEGEGGNPQWFELGDLLGRWQMQGVPDPIVCTMLLAAAGVYEASAVAVGDLKGLENVRVAARKLTEITLAAMAREIEEARR